MEPKDIAGPRMGERAFGAYGGQFSRIMVVDIADDIAWSCYNTFLPTLALRMMSLE